MWRKVAGDQPQQRGLAGAVGSDQSDLGPIAHPERDLVQQHPPVRQLIPNRSNVHMTHRPSVPPLGDRQPPSFPLADAPGYLADAPGYLADAPGYLADAPGCCPTTRRLTRTNWRLSAHEPIRRPTGFAQIRGAP